MTQLDEKDIKIMEALTKYGPKISTESLSQKLDIPSRTIRYRIFKLKEKGVIEWFLEVWRIIALIICVLGIIIAILKLLLPFLELK